MTAGERDDPAAALGDIWEALDSLPRSAPSPAATATTIEMVAISAQHRSVIAARPSPQAWIAAAVLLVAAFVAGVAAGRATISGSSSRFPQQSWPFAEYLDLLQEVGSVEFLHEVDRRAYPWPRTFPFLQKPAGEDPVFEAALGALRDGEAVRGRPADLTGEQRQELEDRMREVSKLEGSDRRRLGELARALANPDNEHLVAAARLWHAWVASRDPAERRTIISLDTDERLEWLDRYSRLQSRMPSRPFNAEGRPPRLGPPPRGETPAPPR